MQPADHLAGLPIADKNRQRAKIQVSGLVDIVGPQTVADHRCISGIELIGYDHV